MARSHTPCFTAANDPLVVPQSLESFAREWPLDVVYLNRGLPSRVFNELHEALLRLAPCVEEAGSD
jgi:hypothetical protein